MKFATVATLLTVAALLGASAARAQVSSSGRACSSYPAPGTIAPAGTRTPADLVSEYGVLGQRQQPADNLTRAELGRGLSASGIVMTGIRFLAVTPSAALVYLVPAEHYLTFRLAPGRCLRPPEQAIERSLRPYLEREYKHPALCLLIVYVRHSTSTCSAAPGTVDPLLNSPGNPGFGLVPNGVSQVLIQTLSQPSLDVPVHRNFWVDNVILTSDAPLCGLYWLDGPIVLRTVKSCGFIDTD